MYDKYLSCELQIHCDNFNFTVKSDLKKLVTFSSKRKEKKKQKTKEKDLKKASGNKR